jgi:hypothetical protein
MDAVLTRVRLRVAPGATRAGVVGRHGDAWVELAGLEPDDIDRRLSSAAGKERRT